MKRISYRSLHRCTQFYIMTSDGEYGFWADDFTSQPAGNAGNEIACGAIFRD